MIESVANQPSRSQQSRGGVQSVLESIVDRLPKARALSRGTHGRLTRDSVERLMPHLSPEERESIVRGTVRHRLGERAIFHFHSALPNVASFVSKAVRLGASGSMQSLFASNEPIIIGSAHFGPLFFELLVLRRLTRDRHVIVVLRRGALYLSKAVPFLRRFGFEIVFDSPDVLRALIRTLHDRPRTVLMFMLDHTHDGRRGVPFLAAHVTACNGIGLIADAGEARVVTAIWRWHGLVPRVDVAGPYAVDRSLRPAVRRMRMLDELNEWLQTLVRETPEQWSGWSFVSPRIVDGPPARP